MGELGVLVARDRVASCTVVSWGGDLTVTEVAGRPMVLAIACAPAVLSWSVYGLLWCSCWM